MSIVENASLAELVKEVLVSMVEAQTQANKAYVESIKELADTEVAISYKRKVDGKEVDQVIKGTALSFGLIPSMFVIKGGVIELKTALTVTENAGSKSGLAASDTKSRSPYLFKAQSIDAKYQNTYAYKADASSVIKITIAPIPPSEVIADISR
jgi:hypothetical protein